MKGFTLIELLIVVTLLSVVGVITAQIFIVGTRSQAKSEIIKEVKQNGDYVEYVVENMVRNAVDITCPSDPGKNTDTLTVLNEDGGTTVFDCSSNTSIASASGLTSLSLHSSKVKVTNCNFRIVCPTPPINPKYVFFTFSMCQKSQSVDPELPCPGEANSFDTNAFPENRATIDYQTTVALRNYQ